MATEPSYPKRLIEVDLPIKRISAHARREKSIRHGHISTLHIWWARRPLAACRAVICASLWPDPVDPICPQSFRDKAAEIVNKFAAKVTAPSSNSLKESCSPESLSLWLALDRHEGPIEGTNSGHRMVLRQALLDFIADFANWDNSTRHEYLDTSKALTQAAHESLGGESGTKPLVVDPFAGGGAIPLEALRVGADTFASDLNPVAVLLNKVVLEYIPKYGQRLADEVRKLGQLVKEQAESELIDFFPKDPDGSTPIAYLWARTISCEGPNCGAEVPLMRSLWLAKRSRHSIALCLLPTPQQKRVDFEIVEDARATNVGGGTAHRGSGTCPCCGYTTPVASVRRQLKEREGGAVDARLLAVVTTRSGQQGRSYRLPTEDDMVAVGNAAKELQRRSFSHVGPLSLVPDEQLPVMSGVFNAPLYGHSTWGSLFTPRQALTLSTLARLVREVGQIPAAEDLEQLAGAVKACLALAVDRQANTLTSISRWDISRENVQGIFTRQAIPMVWDFVEANSFSGSTGDLNGAIEWIAKVCEANVILPQGAQSEVASATSHPLPDDSAQAFITDPPYYNAVPYADLSDFFYVWLKRTVGDTFTNLFDSRLAPKNGEICEMAGWDSDRYPHKTGKWFEEQMCLAIAEGRRILEPSGIGVVVFAHKTTAGWEALLQAMMSAGWMITGSWPIDTEMGSRLRARDSAALASSIHLVCRPRENRDGSVRVDDVGDWRDVLQELPQRIHEWMPRLADNGVVGADAIFACLGPALEIYSRHSRVEKASGEVVPLNEFLEQVWTAVSREALTMIFEGADATGFEEDARLTAIWLWTLSTGPFYSSGSVEGEVDDQEAGSTGGKSKLTGFSMEYDAARKIAQGLGAHLENLSSLVEVKGHEARMLSVGERARHLFGTEANRARPRSSGMPSQPSLFSNSGETDEEQARQGFEQVPELGQSLLDRVHQSMLLFASGSSASLNRFLVDEGAGRDQRFWRLAQALSALYPSNTEEKRWVDGVMARKIGLGL